MHHIIYISQAIRPLTDLELVALLKQAHQANSGWQVTGALVHGDGQFMQVLEGERAIVKALYAKIECDSRHKGVFKLTDEAIPQRNFPEWRMAFRAVSSVQFAQLVGYCSPTQLVKRLPALSGAETVLMDMMRNLLVEAAS